MRNFMRTRYFLWIALLPLFAAEPRLIESRRIWDRAPHNAFTDLLRFRGQWYCAFREGAKHVSPDGSIRIIRSRDGRQWQSAALLKLDTADLRDAKLSLAPDGKLTVIAAGAMHQPSPVKHQTYTWQSRDGVAFEGPHPVGDPDFWLWRLTWQGHTAYSAGYNTAGKNVVRLYRGPDSRRLDPLVPTLFGRGFPNEASLLFLPDKTALCLLRRDGEKNSAQIGRARPPYTEWEWQDLGIPLGGPQLIRLPDGRLVAAGRLYDGTRRTSLLWLDAEQGRLTEFLALPSGGDTSYPGLVWHKGELWVSYYSSHEGKTSIYLARVAFR
jgi:hypothetical protein